MRFEVVGIFLSFSGDGASWYLLLPPVNPRVFRACTVVDLSVTLQVWEWRRYPSSRKSVHNLPASTPSR
jgi:hypothetical protein